MNNILKLVFTLTLIGVYRCPVVECIDTGNYTTYEAMGDFHHFCDDHHRCNTSLGLVCAEGGLGIKKSCQCKSGFGWEHSKCIQVKVDHGEVCKDHEAECKITLHCVDKDPTSGKDVVPNICKCSENFDWFPNSDKCIECEEVVGGSCSDVVFQEKCCNKEYNFICEDGKCACTPGNVPLSDGSCGHRNDPPWWLIIIGIAVLFLFAVVGFLLWFFLWYRKSALTHRYNTEVAQKKMKETIKNPKRTNINVEESYVVS